MKSTRVKLMGKKELHQWNIEEIKWVEHSIQNKKIRNSALEY